MPANESLDLRRPGEDFTFKASAAVTGKRVLKISGDRTGGGHAGLSTDLDNVYQMAHCAGASTVPVAVASYDCASGALGRAKSGAGRHVTCTAGAAITAGVQVMADANGKVITYVGPVTTTTAALPSVPIAVGVAMTGATTDGDDVEIRLWI